VKKLVALASLLALSGSLSVAAVLASSGATPVRAADPSFAPSGLVPTGLAPCSVTTANLNGDGNPDLVVANCHSEHIVVLLGDGGGSFHRSAGSPIAVGQGPASVAAADFDGDAKIDLAIPNGGSKDVTVLLGDGAGAFRAAPGSPVRVGRAAVEVTAADLNADGNTDLVVPAIPNRVAILLGDGSGRFGPAPGSPIAIGGRYGPTSVAVADLNRDGNPDLAVAKSESPAISIFFGNGAGRFGTARTILARTHADTLAVADLSRDGNPDLAIASLDPDEGQVRIALGNRAGGFRLVGSPIAIRYPEDLATADLNGDEKLDLAVASLGNDVRVLLGNGGGGFRPATDSPFPLPEPTPFFSSSPDGIVAADLNGDGKTDLAMAVNQGLNRGSGEGVTILWQTPSTPAAAPGGALPGRRDAVFSTRGRIGQLAVDGNRVASVTTSRTKGRCGLRIVVWSVLGRRPRSFIKLGPSCAAGREAVRGYYVDQLALGGGQVAWIGVTGGNDLELHLEVAKLAGRAAKEIDFVTSDEGGVGEWVGQLLGGGPLLAYNRWAVVCDSGEGCPPGLRLKSKKLVRISAGRGLVVRRGADSYPLGAVGGGRMAVDSAGAVTVLAPSGSPVATVPAVAGNPPRAIALSRTHLAVERTFTLDLYAPATGAEAKSLPLGPAAALKLADVNSKLALLRGPRRLVLVRLSDGKLISLPLRSGTAKRFVDIRLDGAGLFYAYNSLRGSPKGRVAFEPTAKLLARF
jgi:hypothetical protein